jgi:hypothetical protein
MKHTGPALFPAHEYQEDTQTLFKVGEKVRENFNLSKLGREFWEDIGEKEREGVIEGVFASGRFRRERLPLTKNGLELKAKIEGKEVGELVGGFIFDNLQTYWVSFQDGTHAQVDERALIKAE